ncbi:DUF2345 domain-containing protein, partial [Curvibacter sp. CHRR-16]|uniref:DUF2345 domain-containing protein n=1 Tax=Curvibacter sp. CHRR-16 TaxID=2835872 RepID=UPI001BD92817
TNNSKHPELSEPHLVLASPAGIESTTTGSTHQHSNEHHAITAGGHVSVATAKSWLVSAKDAVRMFSYNTGIKLISAATNIDAQALSKSLHVLAKLRVTQSADTITFTAQEELRIKAGGSFTTLSASGITHGTAGQWDVKAATQGIEGPKGMGVNVAGLPHSDLHSVQFEWQSPTGGALANRPYELVSANGGHVGVTGADGQMPTIYSKSSTPLQVKRVWAEFEVPPVKGQTSADTDSQS